MAKPEDIGLLSVAVVVFILNAIELKLLLKRRKGLSNFEKMLLSMAVADFLVGIVQAVSSALRMADTKGSVFKFNTVLFLTVAASFNHVNAITVDRFLAVRWPIKHRVWITNKVVNFTIIGLWVVNIFALTPLFIEDSMDYVRYVLAIVVMSYIALMCVVYVFIVYRAVLHRRRSPQMQGSSRTDQTKKDFQLVIISLCIVVTFTVCTVPFCISAFVDEEIRKPFKYLLVLNSFFNPLIYFFWKYSERRSRHQQGTSS